MSLLEDIIQVIEEQESVDLEQTLGLVLARLRRHTAAEAGSIFVARPVAETLPNHLEILVTQNDLVSIPTERFTVPIDLVSIAGYVASTGDVIEEEDLYNISPEKRYKFNEAFDVKHNYKSRSMLSFPLKNVEGHVIGVVQLINHIAGSDEEGNIMYTPFPESEVENIRSIITMLGALIERYDLLDEIHRLRRLTN